MPGFNGIKYATLREPLAAAFRAVQKGGAQLSAMVQDKARLAYELIKAKATTEPITPVENTGNRSQPSPSCGACRGAGTAWGEESGTAHRALERQR